MIRSKKAVSVSFLALAFLVGCGDSEPSNSDIKKQLLSRISPCPELSIADFQKINGYPQNDGTYIDQVQYNIVFTPSDQMLDYVADYANKQQAIENEGAADTAKIQTARDQANALACTSTYLSAIPDILASLNTILPYAPGLFSNSDPANDEQLIDNDITTVSDNIKYMQQKISSDESNRSLWPQVPVTVGGGVYLTQKQVTAADQKTLAEEQNNLNILGGIKVKLENSVNQLSTCLGNEQKIIQNNQSAFDHINALNAEMTSTTSEYINKLRDDLTDECKVAFWGHSVLTRFNANENDINAYGKTYTVTESGTVHLVKSDNGWVIQN
jgi:hypothetical protein